MLLQGLYVLKFDPQRGMVKTVFDERCTYKGMRFQSSDHQRGSFSGEGRLSSRVPLCDSVFSVGSTVVVHFSVASIVLECSGR